MDNDVHEIAVLVYPAHVSVVFPNRKLEFPIRKQSHPKDSFNNNRFAEEAACENNTKVAATSRKEAINAASGLKK